MTDDIPTISANSKPYGQRSPSNRRGALHALDARGAQPARGCAHDPIRAQVAQAQGATILLMSDDGVASGEIARFLTVTPGTVAGWRSLYARHGIDTVLAIAPRRNDKRKHRPNVDAAILALALAEPPCGCRWWTYRQIATYVEGVSVAYVAGRPPRRHRPAGRTPTRLQVLRRNAPARFDLRFRRRGCCSPPGLAFSISLSVTGLPCSRSSSANASWQAPAAIFMLSRPNACSACHVTASISDSMRRAPAGSGARAIGCVSISLVTNARATFRVASPRVLRNWPHGPADALDIIEREALDRHGRLTVSEQQLRTSAAREGRCEGSWAYARRSLST